MTEILGKSGQKVICFSLPLPFLPPSPPPSLPKLYDWVQVNRQAVIGLLKDQDPDNTMKLSTDVFTSTLQSIEVPLDPDDFSRLFAIYDKKNEGVINYDEFIGEQKYIHAVSANSSSCMASLPVVV